MDNHNNIKSLVKQQNDFFLTGKTKSLRFRKEQLIKLKDLIESHEQEIFNSLHKDFRKPEFESYLSENGFVIEEINMFLKKLGKWTKKKRLPSNLVNFPSSSFEVYEPYGITLIIAPWNYPFQLAMNPLLGAMAAGNCAVLKPSELAPATSKIIAEIINQNFDKSYIHVIEGDAIITQALLKERFDYIFFTGGERVGKIIAEAAAKNLTPVTLELGGKSPTVVDGSMNMKFAAKRIAWGKLLNCGQTCVAPDFIYVQKDYKDELLLQLKKEIIGFYGEDPSKSEDMPRIINNSHFDRVKSLIDPAKIYYGGEVNREDLYIAPTILTDITWDDPVMQEEIFGPILPVMTYNHIEEVIAQLVKRNKPLSFYIFSNNKKLQDILIDNLSFGCGAINDTMVHYGNPHIAFGGVGNSGYGSYHGKNSFNTFSHRKGILKKNSWIDITLRYAPYKNKMKLLRFAFRNNYEW